MAASWSASLAVYCVARAGPKPCSMSFHVFIVSSFSFRLFPVCSCSHLCGCACFRVRFPVRHGIMGAIGA